MPNHNGNNCTTCVACFNNCSTCPKHICEVDQMNLNNMEANLDKKIRFVSYLDSEYTESKFSKDYPDYLLLWSK